MMSQNLSFGARARFLSSWSFLCFFLFPGWVMGQANWNHAFSSEEADIFGFDTASFFVPGQEGFVLLGTTGDEGSQAVARFDGSGNEAWSAFLTAPSALGDSIEIAPDVANLGQFYASYFTPTDNRLHVGRFNGSDFSPIFAKSYPMEVEYDRVELNQVTGTEGAIVQWLDDGVQVLLLDASGNKVFEKKYTGAPFADLGTAESLIGSFQTVSGGFLLLLERTGTPVTDPVTFMQTVPREFTVVRVDSNGAVTGARSMSVTTGSAIPATWSVLPSGDILLGILDFVLDPLTFEATNTMRYVLIGADLSLKWSFQAANSALFASRSDSTGSELYLAGAKGVPGSEDSETDAVIARVDLDTGALTVVQSIDLKANDTAYITAITGDAVYGAIISSDLTGKAETTAFRLSRTLASPVGLTYSGPQDFGFVSHDEASGNVLFAVTEGATTRALTLSSALAPSITCPDLNPATLTLVPGLVTEAFAVTLAPVTISAADEATPEGATSFSLSAFTYTATPDGFCVEGPDPGETGVAPTFDFSGPSPKVTFPTEIGEVYLVNVSTDLMTFLPITTVFGDGTVKEYVFTVPTEGALFIEIAPFSFGP